MKKNLLYIIPGFGESVKDEGYKKITIFANKNGYKVIPVPIVWKNRTASNWLDQFKNIVEKNGEDAIVIGFSFGAYLSVLASNNYKFKKIIVCSLSPYFSEDLHSLPDLAYKILKKRRMDDFKKYTFPKKNFTQASFYVGTNDLDIVINRVNNAYKLWKGRKKVVYIKNVGHEIEAPLYMQKIFEELKRE